MAMIQAGLPRSSSQSRAPVIQLVIASIVFALSNVSAVYIIRDGMAGPCIQGRDVKKFYIFARRG